MKGFIALLCFVTVAVLAVQGAVFSKCDSPSGEFTKVTVSGCSEADKDCALTRNTVANITIDFVSKVHSPSLTTVVHGHVAGVDVPFPLDNPNACELGVSCPMQEGNYEYMASLPILKAYPKIKVTVKWELQDADGKNVVCVKIPAKIQ